MKELREEREQRRTSTWRISEKGAGLSAVLSVASLSYFVNVMQNLVKYLREEARLSLMMGTFCLMCMMMDVT